MAWKREGWCQVSGGGGICVVTFSWWNLAWNCAVKLHPQDSSFVSVSFSSYLFFYSLEEVDISRSGWGLREELSRSLSVKPVMFSLSPLALVVSIV